MDNITNGRPSLDETEIQKEAKRIAREERRRQKEEALEEQRLHKASKQPMPPEKKKKIIIMTAAAAGILIACILLSFLIKTITNYSNPNQQTGLILLTDLTGYTEEDAMKDLREMGFVNIKREYTYDQFTQDGCVIKTDHHINSELKPDDLITVFICDKSLIQLIGDDKTDISGQGADRTYFTMDNISIVDMAIKDNTFYAILRNNNSQAIKKIQYRIGYQDSDGSDIGENKYKMDNDFTVLPGEKFQISMEIRNRYAYYIYISGLTYEKVEVPTQERN